MFDMSLTPTSGSFEQLYYILHIVNLNVNHQYEEELQMLMVQFACPVMRDLNLECSDGQCG